MKTLSLISTGVLVLLLGAIAPTYAQEPKPEQEAKPPKQEEPAKPKEDPKKAKPAKQEPQPAKVQEPKQQKQEPQPPAKVQQQQETKQQQAEPQQHQQPQANSQQHEQTQGQWAHNGQKDNRGHEYNESRFGRDHHARFEEHSGRSYSGRQEYSYGGYWFYAGAYPPWFYQQDVYFVMGADGLWYAVAYGDPSLTFQVYIE